MVYESDFYTTRRPYRSTPAYSSYTVSSLPSRQIRVLPGLGKVHIVHTYDRIVPYVGHKRLTVVTSPPKIYATRSSVLQREYDWIENKLRPWVAYSPTNRYLNSKSAVIFDDETKLIRAQTASLLKQIHLPVPRTRSWAITPLNRYGDYSSLPVKYSNDTYIHRLLTVAPNSKIHYATYYTEPVKKYIGQGHLSCVSYAGDKSYSRRRPLTIYEDALKNDIQLLSYYINKFRQEKSQPKEIQAPLSSIRPSRIFSVHKSMEDPVAQEIKDLKEARAARLAKIYEKDEKSMSDGESSVKFKRHREEVKLAKKSAIFEEQRKQELQAKKTQEEKQEKAKKAELELQKQVAVQAAAERALELEKEAEAARIHQIGEERIRQEEQRRLEAEAKAEDERIQQEEQRRLEAEAKAEEERKQLLRLEEIARQAEEEKEAELARQAEELAELAKQEAELLELERQEKAQKEKEREEAELARQQAELARQEKELTELAIQEAELAELAKQEAELAEVAKQEAELSQLRKQEAELAELARQEAELAELERQEAELIELAKQEAELVELENHKTKFSELLKQEAELAELEKQETEVIQLAKQEDDLIEKTRDDTELMYNDDFQPKGINDYDMQNQELTGVLDTKASEIIFETENKPQFEVTTEKTVLLQKEEFNAFSEE